MPHALFGCPERNSRGASRTHGPPILVADGSTNMKTDAELKSDVTDELTWDPAINAAHVGVTVLRQRRRHRTGWWFRVRSCD